MCCVSMRAGGEEVSLGGKGTKEGVSELTGFGTRGGNHFDVPSTVEHRVGHVCVDSAGHPGGIARFIDDGEGDGVC